ncbi:MAG: hypothetical protein LBP67_03860 [Bacteroidales bacterium]|jgi:hypothetical protein|nr:hypothetical protein [Bacteroidales bacterium]
MAIIIKEIVIKTTIDKQNKETISYEFINDLKRLLLKELRQEKTLYKTNKKER